MGEAKLRKAAQEAGRPWPRDVFLTVLTVGHGDTTLSFDPAKPAEVERASKIVTDMLRRGFAILVQVGKRNGEPLYQRAKAFDPKTKEYIIVGVPPDDPEADDAASASPKERRPRGRRRETRLPAMTTPAVAVARSAGG